MSLVHDYILLLGGMMPLMHSYVILWGDAVIHAQLCRTLGSDVTQKCIAYYVCDVIIMCLYKYTWVMYKFMILLCSIQITHYRFGVVTVR